ncbi:Enzyme that catalyzes the fourth step in the histidine pathway [Lithohypha guttulata]|uniref:Enzyme that catalyzes the fourth step in the histidine pathway n=1 Tax=Lithohypha guttulata TaxID=1690604 RepID=A0AAN7Y9H3_9EURO|nr:Enzyme that catalyzes the fourth step in the histidine pathway [Lithohypha guttulata]KAK5083064.1 Enzyme that catalyzes the fourth step in the histidine pathway [Lithohypha guttulata]
MTRFRPCIDLHAGQVKQIVGGTLTEKDSDLKTNYVSQHSAAYYANLYKETNCLGAHVIMLGPGNDDAAREALSAWPGKLQVGGGITDQNAQQWIDAGAEKVGLRRSEAETRISELMTEKWRKDDTWFVAMNKWQTMTEMEITKDTIAILQPFCSEFLVHAADNEGLQAGIDHELVAKLAEWCTIPVTYAGGARTVEDLELVRAASDGKVDLTIGSALDVFGGEGAKFVDCVAWNSVQEGFT